MKTTRKIVATIISLALRMCAAAPALAAPVVLDFEGATNSTALNDFYNGGTDAAGASGVNYGINFSSTNLALVDSDAGGNGNFGNEPSPSTILFFLSGGAATMNLAAGFTSGFSFFYTKLGAGFRQ